MANPNASPADMALAPVRAVATVSRTMLHGLLLHCSGPLLEPSPNCPNEFAPQDVTAPFFSSARLWFRPAAIALTSPRALAHGAFSPAAHTGTGTSRVSVLPSPSCPVVLTPHDMAVPF